MTPAFKLLREGAVHLRPFLQPSGELYDPVFGEPTQYGTAYFAYVNAAMGQMSRGPAAASYFESAQRGLGAALRHLLDPADPPATSSYAPPIASPTARNHRDFMLLPVMRCLRLLRATRRPGLDALAEQVRKVAVPEVFAARPPHNWAAVWLVGEWLRTREGLSSQPAEPFDAWLAPFFEGPEARVDLEKGFYYEPGYPNSYDLFTRYHLLELLAEGYAGRHRPALEQLLLAGLRRSLAVQLSNGSLPSAHRSTGQLWTLTAQCAYFYRAAELRSGEALADKAREAASRSFAAALGCRRRDGGLSPVENALPANFRVGYEPYTADAHYVPLALAFLASAVMSGFTGAEEPAGARGQATARGDASPQAYIEAEPLWRSLLHRDGWSVHVNLAPQPGYDAFGVADVSPGTGRWLRFGGQARHVGTGSPLTLGLAVRGSDGVLRPLAAAASVKDRFARFDRATGCLEAGALVDGWRYRLRAGVVAGDLSVVESAGERACSLIVPYLRDRGDGARPVVEPQPAGLRLSVRGEHVEVSTDRPVERALHLPHGYESRHGLVGVVRLDLAGTGPVAYRLHRR
ncbi:MAG: hypothetical protein M0005_15955 [Actinomycetota bacterium]|nr:hypothetical protein [Actinomycetota bacterium]